jgi:hypothetical protein
LNTDTHIECLHDLSSGDIQKRIFLNDLLFSTAYFIMYCKVLTVVLEQPVSKTRCTESKEKLKNGPFCGHAALL